MKRRLLQVQIRGAQLLAAPAPGAEQPLPEWIHLMPMGEWLGHPSGPMVVDAVAAAQVVATFKRRGIDLVIDYEHQTMNSQVNGLPAPAAGWIDVLEVRTDGIWGHVREWTQQAQAYLRAREYRYLSPVFWMDWWDLTTGEYAGAAILCVALTNMPFLGDDLVPIVARPPTHTGAAMNWLAYLIPLLALPATATDEEAKAALEAKLAEDPAAPASMSALAQTACTALGWTANTLPADAPAQLERQLKHSGYVSFADHAAALRAAGAREQALSDDQLLAKAEADGKVTPAMRSWALRSIQTDRAGFEAWMGVTSAAIPLRPQVDPANPANPSATPKKLTAEQQTVARLLRLDGKKFAAHIAKGA